MSTLIDHPKLRDQLDGGAQLVEVLPAEVRVGSAGPALLAAVEDLDLTKARLVDQTLRLEGLAAGVLARQARLDENPVSGGDVVERPLAVRIAVTHDEASAGEIELHGLAEQASLPHGDR